MLTYKAAYWQIDKAVDKLASWGATGVAYYREEGETATTPHCFTVTRRNRAWETSLKDRLTAEQIKALTDKSACQFVYTTAAGELHLLLIPRENTEAAKQRLVTLVEKDMNSDKRVRDKGQRRTS